MENVIFTMCIIYYLYIYIYISYYGKYETMNSKLVAQERYKVQAFIYKGRTLQLSFAARLPLIVVHTFEQQQSGFIR